MNQLKIQSNFFRLLGSPFINDTFAIGFAFVEYITENIIFHEISIL